MPLSMFVPGKSLIDERASEHFPLKRAKGLDVQVVEMVISVEPDVAKLLRDRILHQLEDALDVIPVYMRDDEQFEDFAACVDGIEPCLQSRPSGLPAGVDKCVRRTLRIAVVKQHAIAFAGLEQFDLEHVRLRDGSAASGRAGPCPCARLWY